MSAKFFGMAGVAACLVAAGLMSVPAFAKTKVVSTTFSPPIVWGCGQTSSVSIDLSSKVKGSTQTIKKITWKVNYNNSSYSYGGIKTRVCLGKPTKGICTDWTTSHVKRSTALKGDDMTSKLFYVQEKWGTYSTGCILANISATKTAVFKVKYSY